MREQGRPILVWVILVFCVLVSAVWLYSAWNLAPDVMLPFDYLTGSVTVLLYLAAAVTLFLMRGMARYFFVGAVCLEFVLLMWGGGSRVEVLVLGGDSETIIEMVNIAISVVLCVYAFLLSQSGRLR